MAKPTITQFPAGQPQYRIEFDYLARTFVAITLVNSSDPTQDKLLTVGSDYRFLSATLVEILTSQAGFDIVRIHRQTGTDLIVGFRDGSVLTASDLTNAELQAIHIAEEGRDQTVDLAKVYADAAIKAGMDAEAALDKVEAVMKSGLYGYVLLEDFQKGSTLSLRNHALKWSTPDGNSEYYRWDGAFPQGGKVVPPGSTPSSSGGVGLGAWVSVGDASLRSELLKGPVQYRGSLLALRDFYSVKDFGAKGDGSDETLIIQAAIDAVPAGAALGFYGGTFTFEKLVISKPITLIGDGELTHNGFRIKSSDVTSLLLGKQKCKNYGSSSRGFEMYANQDGADYENIKILYNNFEGFFYSTAFVARDYSLVVDPNARVVKNIKIIGCTSKAPSGADAGHFQHIGVTNAETSNCSTYGGRNATSYNYINQNGYIRINGNYDQNNLYGSCELENSDVSISSITGNTFGADLWVDDTSNVTVSGNTVATMIRVTAETVDVRNLNISSNTAKRIRIEQFGASPSGFVYDTLVSSNTLTGADSGGTDMFLGALVTGEVSANLCNGPSTHIGVTRRPTTNLTIRNNRGKGGALLIGNTGGRVIEYGNDTMVVSGVSDSKHISNMMLPNRDYLDLPGKYLHGTKSAGSIAPGSTASISLAIPTSPDPTFRGVALWVLIRDSAGGNMSSFRIDGRYVVFGSVQLSFGTPYSTQGPDSGSVTVGNNASTTSSINILVTNTSSIKTLQVTVMPEVTSRLGTEE